MFCKNYCRFLLTSAFLPPNVFIYRNADLLYITVCFKIMFNKCLYINAYVQKPTSKGKVTSKMFEVALRTDIEMISWFVSV